MRNSLAVIVAFLLIGAVIGLVGVLADFGPRAGLW
jgi:hypothetical protein